MTTPDTMGKVVPYDPAKHEGFVLESWVRTWSRSRPGVQLGANNQQGPGWRRFWEENKPLAHVLLRTEDVAVLEDKECPGVIWGWCARSPNGETIHDVVIKRELTRDPNDVHMMAEARDMVTQLLEYGRRPNAEPLVNLRIGHTGDLAAMRVLKMWPVNWHYDTTYFVRKLMGIIREEKAA